MPWKQTWHDDEIDTLRRMRENGLSIRQISKLMGRDRATSVRNVSY